MSRVRVPGFTVLSYDAQGGQGSNEGWWGTGRVYVKPNHSDHQFLVANEFLCARLAQAIGLPTPAGEVGVDIEQRTSWVTAAVEHDGELPGPEDPADLISREPDLSAGAYVFDVWVQNIDRSDYNIISHPSLGLWLIDHDQALAGPQTGTPAVLAGSKSRPLGYHVFRDQKLDGKRLHWWGQRITAVPKTAIERLADEGYKRGLYERDACAAISEFLLHRSSEIHRLVRQSRPEPPAIPGADQSERDAQGGEAP